MYIKGTERFSFLFFFLFLGNSCHSCHNDTQQCFCRNLCHLVWKLFGDAFTRHSFFFFFFYHVSWCFDPQLVSRSCLASRWTFVRARPQRWWAKVAAASRQWVPGNCSFLDVFFFFDFNLFDILFVVFLAWQPGLPPTVCFSILSDDQLLNLSEANCCCGFMTRKVERAWLFEEWFQVVKNPTSIGFAVRRNIEILS